MLDTATKPKINGIDLERLGEIVEGIEKDTSEARLGFKVLTRWTGGTRCESSVDQLVFGNETFPRQHKIVADEPTELGGGDTAANPQELLMAAFNACITVGYVAGAAMKGITLDSLEIETQGELDLRGFFGMSDAVAPGYETISYEVRIKGDGTPEEFEEIHQAVMKTSPNYFNMSRPIKMDGTLSVG